MMSRETDISMAATLGFTGTGWQREHDDRLPIEIGENGSENCSISA